MPFDIISVAGGVVLKRLIDRALDKTGAWITNPSFAESSVAEHTLHIERWSSSIQILNMARALSVDESTIELTISDRAPRFYTDDVGPTWFDESQLLELSRNLIILGGPGTGKTTTVKRLCRKIMLQEPVSNLDLSRCAVLVKCRDIESGALFSDHLISTLGLEIEISDEKRKQPGAEKRYRNKILSSFLENLQCVLFIDGIDEYTGTPSSLLEDIESIANSCSTLKIIGTCRNGFIPTLPGQFKALQIEPLTTGEKEKIVQRWAKNPDSTLAKISENYASDLVDRPLFLIQVVLLLDWHGFIPDKPSELYRRLMILVLELWDNQKGPSETVNRRSRYERFSPNYKLDFLSEFAYWLVKNDKIGVFNFDDFATFYGVACSKYDLPGYEVSFVLNELEAHTGFVVEAGYHKLQFIHLTFQEFLAANYLSSDIGDDSRIYEIFLINPSVFAIVVAMSRSPSRLLADVVLRALSLGKTLKIEAVFERLSIELPRLETTSRLGLTIWALLEVPNLLSIGLSNRETLMKFVERFALKPALSSALEFYVSDMGSDSSSKLSLSLTSRSAAVPGLASRISVEKEFLAELHASRPFTFGVRRLEDLSGARSE